MITILKSNIKFHWALHACSNDTCYYLIKKKNKLYWRTIDEIDDCSDMILTDTKKEIIKLSNKLKAYVPTECNRYEISKGYITVEDGKKWFDAESWFYKEL